MAVGVGETVRYGSDAVIMREIFVVSDSPPLTPVMANLACVLTGTLLLALSTSKVIPGASG